MNAIRTILALAVVIMAVGAAPGVVTAANKASLSITQPYWVDSDVGVDKSGNRTVYSVRGNVHEIDLDNANHSNVVDFGVSNGEAVLTYDKSIDRYILNAQGEDGSYRVFWVVSRTETVPAGNNTTATRTINERFTAVIQVNDADAAHISRNKWEATQADAENWSNTKDAFEGVGGEDIPVEDKISQAAVLFQFAHEPFAALEGQIATILTLLVMTPGGIILTASNFILIAVLIRGLVMKLHRREQQLEEIEDLDREKDSIAAQRKLMDLSQADPVDAGLNDHHAQVFRDKVGENLLMILDTLSREVSVSRWKRVILQVLRQLGYAARINRVSTDGGMEFPDIASVDLVKAEPEDIEEDDDLVSLANPPEEVVEAVTIEQLRALNVDFVRDDLDASAVDLPIANDDTTTDDLVAATGVSIPGDIESREKFGELIVEILDFIAAHPYTDDQGDVREEMDLLSMLNLLATTGAERYDLPRMKEYQEVFELAIVNLSQSERSMSKVNSIRRDATLDG